MKEPASENVPYDSESSVTTERGGTGGREVQEGGDIYICTYGRFMLMYGKKPTQYCKAIILQLKKKPPGSRCWRRAE